MNQVTALLSILSTDLDGVLDPYQLALAKSGGKIWPDATLPQARAFMLVQSLIKKYNDEEDPSVEAQAVGLAKFLEGNQQCRDWELHLESTRDEELFNGVKAVMYDFWYRDGGLVGSYNQLAARGRLGPGSNRNCRGADLFTKLFDSPLSATSDDLVWLYTKLVGEHPRWKAAERLRDRRHGIRLVKGNKLSFVNKTVDVARSISTEPTINMWFQLGLGSFIEAGLSRTFGIDLSTQQEINKALARRGSKTGRLATIDLANASNSISKSMTKAVVPPAMWGYLSKLRSPYVELPGKTGEVQELHMVATMGNGFCFPLQTLLFAASVITAYRHLGINPHGFGPAEARNYGVFGDDIICVSEAAPLVLRILRMLGFSANSDKTFVEGPFRESCGGDYWNGHHCRGVYIKRLRTKQDHVVAINALNRWTAHTGIAIPRIVRHIRALITGPCYTVPFDENDDAGIHVPLHRHGVQHLGHGIVPYLCWVPKQRYLLVKKDGSIVLETRDRREKEKPRNHNDDAAILVFLYGGIRGCRITLRQRNVTYRMKQRVTPSWGAVQPQASANGLTGPRLASAVEVNMFSDFE